MRRASESGKIDVERTMQAITDVLEGWVREHPEKGKGSMLVRYVLAGALIVFRVGPAPCRRRS